MSQKASLGPIVSSVHLADGALPSLSELEFGLILAGHAFERWMVRCMTAAGEPGLTATDILVLHSCVHRERPKRLADLCSALGMEDIHLVIYAVKKLEKRGLVESARARKEKLISATPRGKELCVAYRSIRETLLVESVNGLALDPEAISTLAATLRALSGHYDQAARTASAL